MKHLMSVPSANIFKDAMRKEREEGEESAN